MSENWRIDRKIDEGLCAKYNGVNNGTLTRKQRDREASRDEPCRLCRLQKPLSHSHIIPEFMYDLLYDEKGRFWSLTTRTDQRNTLHQKGAREYLLCKDCEKHLNVYETYAAEVFRSKEDKGLRYEFQGTTTIVHGIDYKLFKLFQLSILWRASISSLSFFDAVELGPLEDEIRQMILRNDPGPAPKFSCILYALRDGKDRIAVMTPPEKFKRPRRVVYKFIFGGYGWLFVASRSTDKETWDRLVLNSEGTMPVGYVSSDQLNNELAPIMQKLHNMGRIPKY